MRSMATHKIGHARTCGSTIEIHTGGEITFQLRFLQARFSTCVTHYPCVKITLSLCSDWIYQTTWWQKAESHTYYRVCLP